MPEPEGRRWCSRLFGVGIARDVRWFSPLHRPPTERFVTWVVKTPLRIPFWILWVNVAMVRARRAHLLYEREKSRRQIALDARAESQSGLQRCDIRFINLDHRPDRRAEFENEMRRLGVSEYQRVPGVLASPGALGCALAHVNLLDSWDPSPGRLLLVCEDDAEFVATRKEIDAAIEEFVASPELQAFLLAHNAAWRIPISPRLSISSDIATTAAFVIRAEIVPELLTAFQESAVMLENGAPSGKASIDVVW